MKKIALIIALILTLSICAVLSACDGSDKTTTTTTAQGDPDSHTHDFGEWKISQNPTCTTKGQGYRMCNSCGYTEAKIIEAFGHDEIVDKSNAPTCTETGLTEGKHCSVCGEVLVAQETLDATGHAIKNGICTVCGKDLTSKGLEFVSNGNGTCYVSGIGTCTDTEIIIPAVSPKGDSVTCIGYNAFANCTGLESIEIPDSITSILKHAFYNCTSLKSVYITDISVWLDISFDSSFDSNPCCNGADLYVNGEKLIDLVIPDGVTSIGSSAFRGCTSLESIIIPDSVTSIGDVAFSCCQSLQSINISDSVTNIGRSAFYNCTNLTSITIPDSVTSIGGMAFYNCKSLERIDIPDSVTSIGEMVLYNCVSIKTINYSGTKAQWNAISKLLYWNSNTGSYTVYCTDGNISK